ncbi:MAG: molybdopterin molybdotransferase MoeA [Micrococcales bacterium]|nr:molybdopterin molybdotransferase MoeA [Micrococcales bacterium]
MNNLSPRRRLSVDQHAATVLAALGGARTPVETVALRSAPGRVLATDQAALLAVPPFTNAAMDGYAFRAVDAPGALPVSGGVPAGVAAEPLRAGTAVRIMTGAPVPVGADAVVPLEDVTVDGDSVFLAAPPRPGQHVREAGEDVRPGDLVLRRGTRLSARHLASATAVGLTALPVARRPRVRVVVTGDEVTSPGAPLGPGQVPDSNGPYVSGAVTRAGGEVAGLTRCPDDAEALVEVLDHADADLVVLTGGASAGDRDVVRDVLEARGCELVHVMMQPGKPQGCGLWDGTPVIALPGNPVSVVVSFAMFVRPAIEALLGQTPRPPRWGVAARGWRSPAGRRQIVPVTLEEAADGRRYVRPASEGGTGSHLIASLAAADALAVVPEERDEVLEGDLLPLLDLP